MTTAPLHPTDGPIHTWFGLSYSNYQVLPRTLMQSMPIEWQERMVACLEEIHAAFTHIDHAEVYEVQAATEHILNEMTDSQLHAAGIDIEGDDEDGPTDETVYHRRKDGAELDGNDRALLHVADPVPHYNRGRTYIEPRITEGSTPDAAAAERDCLALAVQFALSWTGGTAHELHEGIREIVATMPAAGGEQP